MCVRRAFRHHRDTGNHYSRMTPTDRPRPRRTKRGCRPLEVRDVSTSVPGVQVGPQPMLAGEKTPFEMLLVKLFAVVPALALVAAVPLAWGWGLGWADVGLAVFFYTFTCLGVTVGF